MVKQFNITALNIVQKKKWVIRPQGDMDPKKVNALLSEIDTIMQRESDKYREKEVSLSYEYISGTGNVINVAFKYNNERIVNQLCFNGDLDFIDCLTEIINHLHDVFENTSCPNASFDCSECVNCPYSGLKC